MLKHVSIIPNSNMEQGLDTRFAKPTKVPKGWGYELVIINTPLYCGKIMHFNKDAKFSMHFHIKKTETWYINSGRFEFRYIDTTNADAKTRFLGLGDVVTNEIGQPHQIICLEEGDVFEVSTQHFDEDSYRVAKGDSQQPPPPPSIETGVFISHMGLGDQVLLAPAISFSAKQCKKLYVISKENYKDTVAAFFPGQQNIYFLTIPNTPNLQEEMHAINTHMEYLSKSNEKIVVFVSGHFTRNSNGPHDFPVYFYKDMGLDWATTVANFTFPSTGRIVPPQCPYIFVHDTSSTAKVPMDHLLTGPHLLINPDYNMYPNGHPFYAEADKYVRTRAGLTFVDYKVLIENASELHMVASSYWCFAALLKTKASKRIVYCRDGVTFPTLYNGQWTEIQL